MQKEILVSIVIPAFNEERYLGECLDSLLKSNFDMTQVQILLVDNGSTDKTVSIAQERGIQVKVIPDVKVGAVRNHGVAHAAGKFIVFIDSDCVVDPDWLQRGIAKLDASSTLVLGGQYLMRDNPSWLEKYWVLTNSKEDVYQTTLVGGCIFIRKETFLQMNGFDETLNSGEDSDLTNRLRAAGYTVTIDPSMSVIHLGYPSEIIPFIKRQVWHSADYFTHLNKSLSDKIFILSLCFMLASLLLILEIIFNWPLKLVTLGFILFIPSLLSFKRVSRSKTKLRNPFDLLSVYCVDWIYLIGRVIGTLTSLKIRILKKQVKINR